MNEELKFCLAIIYQERKSGEEERERERKRKKGGREGRKEGRGKK